MKTATTTEVPRFLPRRHLSGLVRVISGQPVRRPSNRSRLLALATREALRITGASLELRGWAPTEEFVKTTSHQLARGFAIRLRELAVSTNAPDLAIVDTACLVALPGFPHAAEIYWTALVSVAGGEVILPTLVKDSSLGLQVGAIQGLQDAYTVRPPLPSPVHRWVSWNIFTGASEVAAARSIEPVPQSVIRAACVALFATPTGPGSEGPRASDGATLS